MYVDKLVVIYLIYLYFFTRTPPKLNVSNLLSLINYSLYRSLLSLSLLYWNPTRDFNILAMTFQFISMTTCEELYTYFFNKAIHKNSFIYSFIHKTHYTLADSRFLAFYMSPLEIITITYPATTIAPWIFYFLGYPLNKYILESWYTIAISFFLCRHLGSQDPPPDSPRHKLLSIMSDNLHHQRHHITLRYNFGSDYINNLFRTTRPPRIISI